MDDKSIEAAIKAIGKAVGANPPRSVVEPLLNWAKNSFPPKESEESEEDSEDGSESSEESEASSEEDEKPSKKARKEVTE